MVGVDLTHANIDESFMLQYVHVLCLPTALCRLVNSSRYMCYAYLGHCAGL